MINDIHAHTQTRRYTHTHTQDVRTGVPLRTLVIVANLCGMLYLISMSRFTLNMLDCFVVCSRMNSFINSLEGNCSFRLKCILENGFCSVIYNHYYVTKHVGKPTLF